MKRKFHIGILSLLTLMILVIVGCFGNGSSDDNFSVNTFVIVNGMRQIDQQVPVTGQFALPPSQEEVDCNINPGGVISFTGTTDSNGSFGVSNAAMGSNCDWALTRGTSAKCPTANGTNVFVTGPNQNFGLPCGSEVNTFVTSPSKIDPTNPPATITVTGQNMYSPYGMSQVYFYDPNQTVWLQVTANSVSSDGTTLIAPASGITFPVGFYAAVIYVEQSDGSWNAVGGSAIHLLTPPSPPSKCKPPMLCQDLAEAD